MHKKGDFQFNWIFVLVAGSLFLFFFISFGVKYKDFQEKKISIEVIKNFDNTLTALQSSSFKTFDTLNLPVTVSSRCGKLNIGEKEIETNNIIFSDKKLQNKILIWYEPYKMPFKITSFYYLVPDASKYYLVDNSGDFSSEILDGMPEDIRKKFKVIRSDEIKNNDKLIILNGNKIGNSVLINGNIDEGFVNINNSIYPYVGKELLYGAIFSEDYACLLNKIQTETGNIGIIYKEKISVIRTVNCDYTALTNKISSLQSKLDFKTANDADRENSRLIGEGCVGVF